MIGLVTWSGAPSGAPRFHLADRGLRRPGVRPGKPVPSLRQLAEEHGLALSTVQKTVRLLVEEKVLITRRGRGIYVARG